MGNLEWLEKNYPEDFNSPWGQMCLAFKSEKEIAALARKLKAKKAGGEK